MARYFSVPNAPASNPLAEAITKAISGFQQGFGMARGVKLENEDRARAEEDRQRQQERQAEADAVDKAILAERHRLFEGTAPIDEGSVMHGVSLPSVGGGGSAAPRTALPSVGGAAPSSSLTQPVAFDLPSTGAAGMGGMDMAGAPAPMTPMRPAGSFDPSTGTFTRPQRIQANIPQGSRFRQVTTGPHGFYTDKPGLERDARAQQQVDLERAFTDELRKFEEMERIRAQFRDSRDAPAYRPTTREEWLADQRALADLATQRASAAAAQKPAPPASDGQMATSGFANRMDNAETLIQRIGAKGEPTKGESMAGAIPLIGGALERTFESKEQQQYETLAAEWIRAKLRKESGAAIGDEEKESEFATYFPLATDRPETKALKQRLRVVATEQMRRQAGPALANDPLSKQRSDWDKAAVELSNDGKSEDEIMRTIGRRP